MCGHKAESIHYSVHQCYCWCLNTSGTDPLLSTPPAVSLSLHQLVLMITEPTLLASVLSLSQLCSHLYTAVSAVSKIHTCSFRPLAKNLSQVYAIIIWALEQRQRTFSFMRTLTWDVCILKRWTWDCSGCPLQSVSCLHPGHLWLSS